jgi:ATP-binding cassette subfamily B protein/ATP-binding cassette subfamily C protein/ATP-binding cassette subfamily B multidrug efflux pump
MSFFDQRDHGQLVSRITNDTEAVKQLYTQVLFEIAARPDRCCSAWSIAMLWLDWR